MQEKYLSPVFLSSIITKIVKGKDFLFSVPLITLFIWAYSPAYDLQFRVEQWAIYDYYSSLPNPKSLSDWGHIAFWTPLGDYRFIPLAYLWNYAIFKIFGTQYHYYTTLSLSIYALNAYLISFLARLYVPRSIYIFWITIIFALFLPSAMEIVIWTFFSYKLFQVTLILCALIIFERGIKKNSSTYILLSIIFCFIASLFYEAIIMCFGFWIFRILLIKGMNRWLWISTCLSLLLLYGFCTWFFSLFPDLFGVAPIAIPQPNFLQYFESFYLWVKYGWILDNIGLDLEFRENSRFITMHLMGPKRFFLLSVIFLWMILLFTVQWKKISWKEVGMFFLLLGLNTFLILIGRTATNGSTYLAYFSMYNYIPIIFISPILGSVFSTGFIASAGINSLRPKLAICSLIALVILWANTIHTGIITYKLADAAHSNIINFVEEIIERTELPIIITSTNGPYEIPGLNLLYHALHLLHGERIYFTEGAIPAIVIDNNAIEYLRNNPGASSEQFKNLVLRR